MTDSYRVSRSNDPKCPLPIAHLMPVPSSLHIMTPLRDHPYDTPRAHHRRPGQPSTPLRRAKHQPLTHKVPESYHIAPQRQLVHYGVGDVVGCVQADDARQSGPGAKGTRRKRGYGRDTGGCCGGNAAGVDAGGVGEGAVGLDAVEEGDGGDLGVINPRGAEWRC